MEVASATLADASSRTCACGANSIPIAVNSSLLSYEAILVLYRYVVDGVDDAPRGEARASSGASLLHCDQRDA